MTPGKLERGGLHAKDLVLGSMISGRRLSIAVNAPVTIDEEVPGSSYYVFLLQSIHDGCLGSRSCLGAQTEALITKSWSKTMTK